MAYATYQDVEVRLGTTFMQSEIGICNSLLDRAALIIDAYNVNASADIKKSVSVEAVARAMNVASDVPMGASQGSMSALGYSQSWTMPSGGSVGDVYLSKADKRLLGVGNSIGASNPLSFVTRDSV
jgi:hypothetical protein